MSLVLTCEFRDTGLLRKIWTLTPDRISTRISRVKGGDTYHYDYTFEDQWWPTVLAVYLYAWKKFKDDMKRGFFIVEFNQPFEEYQEFD